MPSPFQWCSIAVNVVILCHLIGAPYTKVEESFNIQAIHDILKYGIPYKNVAAKLDALFDHLTFSGSVPRTFIGALVTAGLSKPMIWLGGLNGLTRQVTVRAVIGLLNASALVNYARSIEKAYGETTALTYLLLQTTQFHINFYASRALPNTFAFCLTTFALPSFLRDSTSISLTDRITKLRRGFFLLTLATVIFRSEIALLLAANIVSELLKCGRTDTTVRLLRVVILPSILVGTVAGLAISIPIDTYLWQSKQFLWPELTGFLFNIFPKDHEGASAWGTSPWHWYFTSAIPRLISPISLLLIPYGLQYTSQVQPIMETLTPPLIYTVLYSFLSHKETRFLFPIVPELTLATAIPASYLSRRRGKLAGYLTTCLVVASGVTMIISHLILLPLSSLSYPGGHALTSLHQYHYSNPKAVSSTNHEQIHVHVTNLALQSGVTRFLEQPDIIAYRSNKPYQPLWIYDKSPTPNTTTAAFLSQFDYSILEPDQVPTQLDAFEIVQSIPALRTSAPRVLTPDAQRGCLVLCPSTQKVTDGIYELLRLLYGKSIAWVYAVGRDLLREGAGRIRGGITRGYWVDWGVEERLVILRRVSV